MKKNLFAILMLVGILFTTSCKSEVEEPTLTLSETATIILPKIASEKAITVTTNQSEWSSMTNADWIELLQSGNTLNIKASLNATTAKRKGEVLVMAGGIARKLVVEQEASDITIVAIPDKLEVDQWGGKYQFDVDANTQNWTVASDAEWVKVVAKPYKSEVVIEVAENVAREARVAKLTLTGGTTAKEFTLTQSGIMYYIMPYLKFGATFRELKEFEAARKSEVVEDLNYVFGGPYLFHTQSPAFPAILYGFANEKLSGMEVQISDKKVVLDKAFDDMMIANNFKLITSTAKSKVFELDQEKTVIRATVSTENKGTIVYAVIPKQTQTYKTFAAFPYGYCDFKGERADVEAWEKANGGTFNKSKSAEDPTKENNFLFFDVKKDPALARAYFVSNKTKKLVESAHYFTEMNLVFWEYEGARVVTNEFMALTQKEGFTYEGLNGTWHVFINEAKDLGFVVRWVKYTDFDNAVVDIHFVPASVLASTNVKANIGKAIKPMRSNDTRINIK